MWLFDKLGPRDCVRLSRDAIERWVGVSGGMKLAASHALDGAGLPQPSTLLAVLRAMYPTPHRAGVDLVLDSTWLPMLLVDTGGVLWSRPQVEALVRHRLGLLYDDGAAKVSTWNLRVDHRAGERYALGAGLPQDLRQSLSNAAREVGLRGAVLTPAFHWGLQRLRPSRGWPGRTGWFVWLEQDRAIVSRFDRGRLTGFNAGAPQCEDADDVERLIQTESCRLGIEAKREPVVVGAWGMPSARPDRLRHSHLRWLPIAGGTETTYRHLPLPPQPLGSAT